MRITGKLEWLLSNDVAYVYFIDIALQLNLQSVVRVINDMKSRCAGVFKNE